MSKMLVILNSGLIMGEISEGCEPFENVRRLDCQNGEDGEVFTFDQSWCNVLHDYFGPVLPKYVQIEQQPVSSVEEPEGLDVLVARIERDIIAARKSAVDPFEIRLDESGDLRIEVKPLGEGASVLVCSYVSMSYTSVNYSASGLRLDVYDAGDGLGPLHSVEFQAEDLIPGV